MEALFEKLDTVCASLQEAEQHSADSPQWEMRVRTALSEILFAQQEAHEVIDIMAEWSIFVGNHSLLPKIEQGRAAIRQMTSLFTLVNSGDLAMLRLIESFSGTSVVHLLRGAERTLREAANQLKAVRAELDEQILKNSGLSLEEFGIVQRMWELARRDIQEIAVAKGRPLTMMELRDLALQMRDGEKSFAMACTTMAPEWSGDADDGLFG